MPEDADLDILARRRSRIAITLTLAMMIVYFGFIFLVAFAHDTVSTLVGDTVSVGILLGAITIVLAPILTLIYIKLRAGS